MQILFQQCSDILVCFVDIRKAFGKVKHDKLKEISQKIGIGNKDIRIINNLYWNQTGIAVNIVRINNIRFADDAVIFVDKVEDLQDTST